MGEINLKRENYQGYKSFDYLYSETDIPITEVSEWVNKVVSYQIPLTGAEEKRVANIYKKCIVIALHDHCICIPENLEKIDSWNRTGRYPTAYKALSLSCIDAVFDNLWAGMAQITSNSGWHFSDVISDLGMRLGDIAHQQLAIKADKIRDILHAHKDGRIAIIFAIESSAPIHNEIDRIKVADIVFSDPKKLKALEEVVHPMLFEELERICKSHSGSHCVIEMPLVQEIGKEDFFALFY